MQKWRKITQKKYTMLNKKMNKNDEESESKIENIELIRISLIILSIKHRWKTLILLNILKAKIRKHWKKELKF